MIKCTLGRRGQRVYFSGVYGHRICLLFSQIPVFSDPTPLFLSAEICAIL